MTRWTFAILCACVLGCASGSWPGPTRPFKGKLHAIPGLIEAEDFDDGGEGLAYHDAEQKNLETRGAPYRDSGVDLEVREDASGKYNLGWTRPGEWLVYTVEVTEAGTYTIDMRVASKGQGGTFHIEFGGADRTGPIEVPDTGGWEFMKPLSKPGVKLATGRQVMRVVMDAAGPSKSIGDVDYFKFTRMGP